MRNFAYILCCAVLLLSSCGHKGNYTQFSTLLTDSVIYSPALSTINSSIDLDIKNESDGSKRFYITPAKYNFHSYEELVASIVDTVNMNGYGNAHNLWSFMRGYTSHSNPIMSERLPHDPLRLVNSFQSGLCDDRNTALSKLFELAGYPSRVYHLDGHVVTEVFFNDSWHMYDADWGVYFRTTDDIVDVAYAAKHPEVIKLWKEHGYVVGKVLGPAILKHVYTTTDNNYVNTWFGDVKLDYKNELELQPSDELNVHIEKLNWEGKLRKLFIDHAITDTRHWATLKRSVKMQRDYHLHIEESPYAITQVSISNAADNDKPVEVYYSYNDSTWIFKGILGGGSNNITFAPTDANGEKVVFNYKLNFVSADGKAVNGTFTVSNKVLVSEKIFVNDGLGFRIVPLSGNGKPSVHLQSSQ